MQLLSLQDTLMTPHKQHGDVFSSVVAVVVVVVPNIGVLGHDRCTLDGILSLSPQLQNVCGLENFPRASINTRVGSIWVKYR